ncbi:MAG: hypothetical protein A2275_14825 [Bacteroidetes bacterium RIFOXYA12_FULL_35_11]|nr:MAG: hypothetical protein A2X01_07685 [Bacteroidetes bacterium GWF2_35_48]OFY73262.1 MAG: hypothetical protein A2275_14825 [Bacteroidetes bacterium RIFOXYA12_FULL_35_11]OFY94030.1 MAG: hypothetical protein A2491_17070 [Bacteroidetes bacterium RIFOXYC12_FULL_35_7]OFY97633.1 MAG: hypothetical protein A2309_11665 [Bacteroidetes bacterium RIFOXYB2_FULL_35_7]HBX52935.1 hypothetical protein [Bacteroidales bacterium]
MRLFLFILLTFGIGIISSNCQDKLSYDFIASNNYCYRELNTNDSFCKTIINSRNKYETQKFSYKIGIGSNYHFVNSFFSLNILFSKKAYQSKIDFSNLIFPEPLHPIYDSIYNQNNTIPEKSINNFTIRYYYYYIDIPFSYTYLLYNKRIKLFISSGLQTNILILAQISSIKYYTDDSKEKINSKDEADYERVNISFEGGIGVEFPITNKLNVIIEPYYERNITTSIQAPIKQYLYSFGLNTKLRYK